MARHQWITALDIGASGIKLGLFAPARQGGIELIKYGVRTLDADPASSDHHLEAITAGVRELVQEFGITGSPALICVSGQAVFSRFVRLPPVSRDKVLQIVRYEAQQNVPFPINEVVWDYQLIGQNQAEMDVMIAAIKADIVESITDAVAEAGLQPDLVDVSPMAVYNAIRYNYSELPSCTLVMDIGARSTDLIFIEANRVFNRSIPVGGNTITQQIMKEFDLSFSDAEQLKFQHAFVAFGGAYEAPPSQVADKVSKTVRSVMTRLHTEVARSINFYRTQQSGGQPTLALLTGGSSVIPYADAFLKEKLGIEIEYLNPFKNVAVGADIDTEQIGANAHVMAGAVGLALRRSGLPCPIEINLIPPKITERKRIQKKQPFFIAAAALGVFTLLLWAAYFSKLGSLGQKRLANLQASVTSLRTVDSQLRARESEVDNYKAKGHELHALTKSRTHLLEVLAELHASVPEGMWLSSVSLITPEEEAPAAPESFAEGAGADAPVRTIQPRTITALKLSGYGYLDKATQAGAIKFRDVLRKSPTGMFTDETEITESPVTGKNDVVLQFTIRAALKEPIKL
jgi:type IV pilus assembly protein PilM